jgi:hypothetical protein
VKAWTLKWRVSRPLTALALAVPLTAFACGLESGIDSSAFSQAYPGSIDVALSMRELIDQNRMEALPAVPASVGFMRVTMVMRKFQSQLANVGQHAPTAMLLVEHGYWARWTGAGGPLEMQLHVAGPEPGDTVVLTGEAVLAAIVAGQLTVEQARTSGAMTSVPFDGAQRPSIVAAIQAAH